MTAELPWHVQNYDMINELVSILCMKAKLILLKFGLWAHNLFVKCPPGIPHKAAWSFRVEWMVCQLLSNTKLAPYWHFRTAGSLRMIHSEPIYHYSNGMLIALCKTVESPLLIQWRYYSLAQSYGFGTVTFPGNTNFSLFHTQHT